MRLSAREKIVIALGGMFLGLLLVWFGVVSPVYDSIATGDQRMAAHERQYEEIQRLAARYHELKAGLSDTEGRLKRGSSSSILSHLESMAQRLNVKSHIVQMKPMQGQTTRHYTESVVEIKMEKVPLSLLVRYLHQVENAKELLRIKELRIRPRFDNPDLLDVRFQVSSYALLDGS